MYICPVYILEGLVWKKRAQTTTDIDPSCFCLLISEVLMPKQT